MLKNKIHLLKNKNNGFIQHHFFLKKKNGAGFSLIEVMVGVAIFVIFAVGIYSGIQFVFKVVYQSRLRIIETAVLNEQIEMIRNMSFYDVGIISGSPAGVLGQTITTTRNNINFTITRTIRNIDDPYDGTIGGDPNDTAPADYKLVEVEIICDTCNQNTPLTMTTQIAPKFLEGDPTHGALFIEVFDADGAPVQGAGVHVVSTSTDPVIDLVDTTDNDGMLRLLDLGEGISAYQITVTKAGFTTDQNMAPNETVLSPVKPLASVVAQDVTEVSFSIDQVAGMEIETIDGYCSVSGGVPVHISGTKLLGTDPVLKVDDDVITNGSGEYSFTNMEWDNYVFQVSNYDFIGSIPTLPTSLLPGANQSIQLILGPNTDHSLLINALDSITGQPISNASVHVSGGGYDETKVTGVGFVRQTDWSGGTGQLLYSDSASYWSDDGKVENAEPAGDLKLKIVGENYINSGTMESSIFDLGASVNFINLIWEPISQPVETGSTSIRFQLAASNTTTPESWEYLGPDGTTDTYYNSGNDDVADVHNNNQYLRYKIFLTTDSVTTTPTVSDVSVSYTTSCTPPGQSYFGDLENLEYTVEVVRDGYQTKMETITIDGDMIFSVEMVAS
ncbi:MAG: prepilin-type N-terminal cleavage/methylation domain-containing protein [Candidatus Magasanikbacteria bacterium]|jgi:prepilin-type N-terminal cleavage/methylation domain-containing protein|nr:prepilin-type N-terminal cleavage/methylation domain-containing protein [Candidatus Magasanikbacteria bacterium]